MTRNSLQRWSSCPFMARNCVYWEYLIALTVYFLKSKTLALSSECLWNLATVSSQQVTDKSPLDKLRWNGTMWTHTCVRARTLVLSPLAMSSPPYSLEQYSPICFHIKCMVCVCWVCRALTYSYVKLVNYCRLTQNAGWGLYKFYEHGKMWMSTTIYLVVQRSTNLLPFCWLVRAFPLYTVLQ